jgi:glucosamine 6-phosphate synthetase-like amidotransferase/phosphosugar isomerase protein
MIDKNRACKVGHTGKRINGESSSHLDCHNKIVIVHRGIIEHYHEVTAELVGGGM